MEVNLDSNLPTGRQAANTARLAALLFFIVVYPTSSFAKYAQSQILVSKDAAATVNNLLSNEFLFRTGIVSSLVSIIAFAWMALLLYRLFRPVDKHLARIMVIPALVQQVSILILELLKITALMTINGEVLINVDDNQRQEFIYLLFRMYQYGINANQLLLGLWLVFLGMLLYRSDFAPRVIGILAIIGGIGFVAEGCVFVLLERPEYLMVRQFLKYTYIPGFIPMLWFLIKGVSSKSIASA